MLRCDKCYRMLERPYIDISTMIGYCGDHRTLRSIPYIDRKSLIEHIEEVHGAKIAKMFDAKMGKTTTVRLNELEMFNFIRYMFKHKLDTDSGTVRHMIAETTKGFPSSIISQLKPKPEPEIIKQPEVIVVVETKEEIKEDDGMMEI